MVKQLTIFCAQILIIGIRLLAASFPGAFEELFRQGGPSNNNVSFSVGSR